MAQINNSAPVDFLNYKGTTIKLSALTLAQQEELASYLRFIYIDEAKKHLQGLPLELSKYAWDRAKAKADAIYPGRSEHSEAFYSPSGLIYGLYLAAINHNKDFTKDAACDVLDELKADAISAVSVAVGYSQETQIHSAANKPLPINEIIHVLCNEPYNHTPQQVRGMTLDDIALIWCKPNDDAPVYSQADQERWIHEARKKAEAKKLGIWGASNMWG